MFWSWSWSQTMAMKFIVRLVQHIYYALFFPKSYLISLFDDCLISMSTCMCSTANNPSGSLKIYENFWIFLIILTNYFFAILQCNNANELISCTYLTRYSFCLYLTTVTFFKSHQVVHLMVTLSASVQCKLSWLYSVCGLVTRWW